MLYEKGSGDTNKGRMAMKRYRSLAALAALLTLVALTPAHAQTLGRTTIGTTPSGGLRADFSRGSKFSSTGGGTLTQLCAYLDGKGGASGSQNVRLVLYRDANGVPGAKISETAS